MGCIFFETPSMIYKHIFTITWVGQMFRNILLRGSFVYITRSKQFKPWRVSAEVGSTVVVSTRTRRALLHFVCDLKVAKMNVQRCLIQEIMLCKFELGHNAAEQR